VFRLPPSELRRATLVATLTRPPAAGELAALPPGVDWIEVRADLVGELDAAALRRDVVGSAGDQRLLYTLRSAAEKGAFGGGAVERRQRLRRAAESFDLVDLEGERDLVGDVLDAIPPEKRLISWHGAPEPLVDLEYRLAHLLKTPAALYKLVVFAQQPAEALRPLELLCLVRRPDVVAFAAGAVGTWTRMVAPYLGAPWIYGSAGDDPGAPGQLPVARLVADYGLPALRPVQALCGVVGLPALHSLSPRLHNAGYRALGLPFLYLPFEAPGLGDFWLEVVEDAILPDCGMPLRGLSVTTPFKGSAVAVAGALSPLAERLSAANTLVCREGVWEGDSTDGEGVLLALGWHGVGVAGTRVVVVGAGAAGRVVALALALAGAQVTLTNRDEERGAAAAAELELPFLPLGGFSPAGFDVVVQATALGRGAADPLPFAVEELGPGMVVVELVYGDGPTPLARAAAERGARVVDGREVLLGQALGQFRRMTGHELPLAVGRRALGLTMGEGLAVGGEETPA
jgi:3-dehydroquinate dehydratase/shikimate dehydrogenase